MLTVEVRNQPPVGCAAGTAKPSGETCGLTVLCGGWKADCWRAAVPARVKRERWPNLKGRWWRQRGDV